MTEPGLSTKTQGMNWAWRPVGFNRSIREGPLRAVSSADWAASAVIDLVSPSGVQFSRSKR